ncbi:MAG TPA: DUF4203 domain-containing protein [Spirochaetota bacterium]|nr:DUF4203 domain-containing protein [Spirochaetota bacterium]
MFENYAILIIAAFFIIGVINCFFGYKLFRVLLFIIGFSLTFYFSYNLTLNFTQDVTILTTVGIVLGILAGILAVVFYFSGIFLIGLLFGILVGLSLNIPFDQITKVAVIIALGLVFGILCIVFQKYMVVILTSFTGGFFIINSVFYIYLYSQGNKYKIEQFLSVIQKDTFMYIIVLGITLLLGIMGVIFQYRGFKE